MFQLSVQTEHSDGFVLLVNLLKHCIWFKRNQAKHNFLKVNTLNIKSLFISTLSLRIKADFQRLGLVSFWRYWGVDNLIVQASGNSIKILLRLHPP